MRGEGRRRRRRGEIGKRGKKEGTKGREGWREEKQGGRREQEGKEEGKNKSVKTLSMMLNPLTSWVLKIFVSLYEPLESSITLSSHRFGKVTESLGIGEI